VLGPGDLIYHPRNGFGTIRGITRRDPFQPSQDGVAGDSVSGQAQDYYDIQLKDGGTLLVPVDRAKRVGLRRLTNGVDAITTCLRSPAQSLPGDARQRAAELWTRGQIGEPTALAASVRDMVTQSRGRTLTSSEKEWLNKACERLSIEAALVDRIPRSQAQAAIWEAVNKLSTT
jgi:RNA polymerase-interacting CarD/CdnL/TRCF family regulator